MRERSKLQPKTCSNRRTLLSVRSVDARISRNGVIAFTGSFRSEHQLFYVVYREIPGSARGKKAEVSLKIEKDTGFGAH